MSTLSQLETRLAAVPAAHRPDVLRDWCRDGGFFLDAPFESDGDRFPFVCELLLEAPTRWVARLVAEATWPLTDLDDCARLHRMATSLTAA